MNSKVYYPKRFFPVEQDMQVKRTMNAVGGHDIYEDRFLTSNRQDHSMSVFQNKKANPETIFDNMAKRSRKQFNKTRLSGLHEPPPFQMKSIDEARNIPVPGMAETAIRTNQFNTQNSPIAKWDAAQLKPREKLNSCLEDDLDDLWSRAFDESATSRNGTTQRHQSVPRQLNKSDLIKTNSNFDSDVPIESNRYSGKRANSISTNKVTYESER